MSKGTRRGGAERQALAKRHQLKKLVAFRPSGIQSAENGKTTIRRCGTGSNSVHGTPISPSCPSTGAGETLNIKTGVLRDMISTHPVYAVSQDEKPAYR